MASKSLSDPIQDNNEDISDSKSVMSEARSRKLTEKGENYGLAMLLEKRKLCFNHVSAKKRYIDHLMNSEDDLETVKIELKQLNGLVSKLHESARIYHDKLQSDEEKKNALIWLESRIDSLHQFESNVMIWIENTRLGNNIRPEDSVSQVESQNSVISSTSSAKMKIEAKRAEIIAKQKMLGKRYQLQQEEARLRQEREELELQTEMEIANAQYEVFDQYDPESRASLPGKIPDAVRNVSKDLNPDAREFRPGQEKILQEDVSNQNMEHVYSQQNEILRLVVEQQKAATLPVRKIPVFGGNPLEFKTFMRAFEHGVEDKTSNPKDRLYFLDQYTSGEPNELVKSCSHMDPDRGYGYAKSLLEKSFGNKYKLATAYMDKALNWPSIKSEDSEALNRYSLFLTSCGNTMTDVDYMRELEHPKNLRVLVQKLPFKLRERWRTVSFNIMEKRKITFLDFVEFVDRQAQILSSPLFGAIMDDRQTKTMTKEQPRRFKSFATDTLKSKDSVFKTPKEQSIYKPLTEKSKTTERLDKMSPAFTRPCWFCAGDHTMEMCRKLQNKSLDEKIEFLKPKGLCFGCLSFGHLSRDCTNRLTCQICKLKHVTCFHDNTRGIKRIDRDTTKPKVIINSSLGTSGNEEWKVQERISCMPVIPVRVKVSSSNRYVETYAFLDSGSSATFCTNKLAKDLKMSGKMTKIVVSTMNQKKQVDTTMLTDLEVGDIDGKNWTKLPTVFTQEKMPISRSTIPREELVHQWPYLRKVTLPPVDADIGLLIGNNAPRAVEPCEIISSEGDGPYAVRTILGWTVNGLQQESVYHDDGDGHSEISVNRTDILDDENLNLQLRQYFNMDFNEPICSDKPEMSREDMHFLDTMNATKKLTEGHYQLALPFKVNKVNLPNNRVQAVERAVSLKRKFKKNETFYNDYRTFLQDIIDKGYAQRVPKTKINRVDGKVWYIPHHGVYHPKKPEKIRVVFDCAAQYQGKSLNDHLLQGPDLTNSLIGVLTRFRQKPIALMADIEAMFYQVRVEPDNYDVLRFLWWPDGNLDEELEEYQMKVHIFGAVSSPSAASFALKETAKDNSHMFNKEVVKTVEKSFYVDDCLTSVSSEREAVKLVQSLRDICKKGGFHLTKWISNSRAVLDSIPEKERAKEVKELDLDEDVLPVERALGVQWCVESDQFKFKINIKERPPTRRGILSMVSSVYDPLGFAGPFVLKAKRILQELCRLKIGWDDVIPEKLLKSWTKWLSELPKLEGLTVNRCIQPVESGQNQTVSQIHHFSDASELGYGTVSYLRQVNENGKINCSLLISKSRVAPLKQITIPRLELSTATLAVKLDRMIKREIEIPIHQTFFWTDSMSVLRYIANDTKRFHTFVANRLSTIHEGSSPSQWKYVESKNNPADEASRGLSIESFLKVTRWLSGPAFLWENEHMWPEQKFFSMEIPEKDTELRKVTSINLIDCAKTCQPVNKLINRYSDWFALKKAVAWLLKIKKALQERKRNMAVSKSKLVSLTVNDLEEAEKAIIQYVQQEAFPQELEVLRSNQQSRKGVLSKTSSIFKLDPFIEDGLLRVGGRLTNAKMSEDSKHPVILPKKCHVSELLIRHIHRECGHLGRNSVLSKLFEKYWVIKANAAVRQEIYRCVTCRRNHATVGNQKMADLPVHRVTPDEPPFTYVGVDYFGPFDVKRGRSHVKRYGVLFTCLTTRAVHIEVAHSLDTDSCINALCRFVSRRGQVKVMRSDNGTNFVGSERELREAIEKWNNRQIHEEMLQRNIEWIFNSPAASHHGGVWERQIRTVRQVLRSMLREQTLDDEALQTVLCEIEAIINNRPISRASSDPNDLEALTPNHLLLLKRKPNLPPGTFSKDDQYTRRRWRQVQYMADLFLKRWIKEYLPLLQERQKWTRVRRNLQTGDIVLIVDNTAPRCSWPMGKIVKLQPDQKGVVRCVKVKTKTTVLDRPVNKLCLLLENEM